LIWGCNCLNDNSPDRRDVTLELLRALSRETRRAVNTGGWSAVDYIISGRRGQSLEPWHKQLIGELLAAGAPVRPQNRATALPIAAERAERRDAELAARRSESRRWRAHDDLVGLALDMVERREARQGVEARRARVVALEEELRELGAGTDSDSESGSSRSISEDGDGEGGGGSSASASDGDDGEGEEEEEEEARAAAAGGQGTV
jgi:hypothetical protein